LTRHYKPLARQSDAVHSKPLARSRFAPAWWAHGQDLHGIASMIAGTDVDLRLANTAATTRLGAAIAKTLAPGDAVCLSGPLGAGKSALARGLIRALAPEAGDVPSPTFTLVQFYAGRGFEIAHFDLYRLNRAEEAFEIGLDEALREGAAVIEWPERLGDLLPADRLAVTLQIEGVARRARIKAHGAWEGRDLEF